jgi:hypothetical protein
MTMKNEKLEALKKARDELRVRVHLASMDAREQWAKLEPRLAEIEKVLADAGEKTIEEVRDALDKLGHALAKLRDQAREHREAHHHHP